MLRYAIRQQEMNGIMELLHRVLDLRITFYDLQEAEVDSFNIKEMSPFCRHCRRDPAFLARCDACDRINLRIAKETGQVHIYHCHAGMLEGIVPLYDSRHLYLGAIVFGQLRDRNSRSVHEDVFRAELRRRSRESSPAEMLDIGKLLKCLGEYIQENEIIKYCNKPWAGRLEEYISVHLSESLTLKRLAHEIGKSTSFLSHNFPAEFGMPLKAYVRKKRMEKAVELLKNGRIVRECAFELGYFDEFHFSRDFKRHFGCPPSRFKE